MSTILASASGIDFPAEVETMCSPSIADVRINERIFGIRAANIEERRNSASMLISKMYAWRGYKGNHCIGHDPNMITLTASGEGEVIGTVSLDLDSEVGLLADQVFKECIDPYRRQGKVCEVTKLAIDPSVKSKALLGSLFHVVFIYATHLNHCTEIFIEVNPRHCRFYQTMLGFEIACEVRANPRVQAPAVLLVANASECRKKIEALAGNLHTPDKDRSLFPYFFTVREEAGIINRLKKIG